MSIHKEEEGKYWSSRPNDDTPFQSVLVSDLGDDFEVETVDDDVPAGISQGYQNGTRILRKKYYVSLGMGDNPITDAMVKERSIFYSWANHPMFKIGDGSARIDGKYLFPKKILINYDRNLVEMDFEMFEIVEKGVHAGYVTKPDNATMEFEYAYIQRGYKIDRIPI